MQIGVEISRAIDNKRIFIVHEDEIIRAILQFMLHDENEAHETRGLDDAFSRAEKSVPDLILLDMAHVWARGLTVLDELRARIPHAKILLVAESDNDPDAHACLREGVVGVIGKPLKVAGVRLKVDLALGRVPSYGAWKAAL
jgi:CheY-like chemotaxis protein